MPTMTVSISPALSAKLNAVVDSGRFSSQSEAVRFALERFVCGQSDDWNAQMHEISDIKNRKNSKIESII